MSAVVTEIHPFIELKVEEAALFNEYMHPSAAYQIQYWIIQAREHFLDHHEVARLLRLIDEKIARELRFSAKNMESCSNLDEAAALRDCANMLDGTTSRWPRMGETSGAVAP